MEVYILISVIWLIGWMYACGVHAKSKAIVRKRGTEEDQSNLDLGGAFQYAVLFLLWLHYLGYGEGGR